MNPWFLPLLILLWLVVVAVGLLIISITTYAILYSRKQYRAAKAAAALPEHAFNGTGANDGQA